MKMKSGQFSTLKRKSTSASKERSQKIVERLRKRNTAVAQEELTQMYDSDGITPEFLRSSGLKVSEDPDFYAKITARHSDDSNATEKILEESKGTKGLDVKTTSPTELIFYRERDQFEFSATVLEIVSNDYVVLDATSFFARAGGQEPDHGTINGLFVDDVLKINNIVLHHIHNLNRRFSAGDVVEGRVDSRRRFLIMRHHTATHIVNGSARKVLGPWVWQNSAFKDEDMARLDITHYAHLTRDQVLAIERLANEVVRRNLSVNVSWIPRGEAEKEYGFRLYQGGVAPVKELRVVNIEGWDVEACGGTHCSRTGEVGLIKITKSERMQDGVERLEYVAGEAAINYVENQESILIEAASRLETPQEKLVASLGHVQLNEESARRTSRQLAKKLADFMIGEVPKLSKRLSEDLRFYLSLFEEGLDVEYHTVVGDRLARSNPDLIYVALLEENSRVRIMVFCADALQRKGIKAGDIARELSKALGGSGGGDARFGQGGSAQKPNIMPDIEGILLKWVLNK